MSISSVCTSDTSNSETSSEGGEFYTHWDLLRGIKRWKPQSLPQSLTIDGKQVWEPPIFSYNHLIGEEYENKRKAVLEYTNNDRARATEILDLDAEDDIFDVYCSWLEDNVVDAQAAGDYERASFFTDLVEQVDIDWEDVEVAYEKLGIAKTKMGDGRWKFISLEQFIAGGRQWSDEEMPINSLEAEDMGKHGSQVDVKSNASWNPLSSKVARAEADEAAMHAQPAPLGRHGDRGYTTECLLPLTGLLFKMGPKPFEQRALPFYDNKGTPFLLQETARIWINRLEGLHHDASKVMCTPAPPASGQHAIISRSCNLKPRSVVYF